MKLLKNQFFATISILITILIAFFINYLPKEIDVLFQHSNFQIAIYIFYFAIIQLVIFSLLNIYYKNWKSLLFLWLLGVLIVLFLLEINSLIDKATWNMYNN